MLGDQPVAKLPDYAAHVLVVVRVDRHVAFGVHTHRAIADIRRADAQPLVVDDHHLRVQVDAGSFGQAFDVRAVRVKMTMLVGCAQLTHEACAQHAHRHLFEPAMTELAGDEHNLRSLGLGKTRSHRLRYPLRCEVLVFDVQRTACRSDHVQVQSLHFPDCGLLVARR